MSVSDLSALGAFLKAELEPRPGRMRAALRLVAASLVGTVLIMLFQIPHGSWMIMTIFTMALADAGASLKKGIERVIGTVVGGLAGLLAVIAFIDLPYVFVPLMGVAITVGLYLSHVLAAPYPPLLGALTYLLVVLSQVEAPEDYVGVALWRITAIVIGVVLSTVAQVFLWPDDPVDKLREALVRRLHLVPMLIDRAIAPPAGPAVELPAVALTLGDLTGELQLLADAEVLHSSLRPRNAEHIALILEVARLFTAAVWAAETTPGTTARVGLDEGARRRLLAIRDESIRFARALEGRRSLLASAAPMAGVTPVEAGSSQFVSAQAPVLDGMERSLDRIAFLTGTPRSGRDRITAPPPGLLSPADVPDATASAPRWSLDIAALKVALKTALGVELCYLAMQGLDWPGLVTSTITCVIVAQSTVGANARKAVLRQVGAVLGGLLGLIVIVVFMPNLGGIAAFLVVMTAGYFIAGWITVGGPRTAYAGIQTALAFGIMLLGDFGPTTDLVSGRDRVLGILLGAGVMGVIDQVLWPVEARRAMRPTLARALRLMAELARVGARRDDGQPADRPRGLRAEIYRTLSATLAYRDESRMEGDPDTPENRAESDMVLHLVTDAQALLPGLLAAAGERLVPGAADAADPPRRPRRRVREHDRGAARRHGGFDRGQAGSRACRPARARPSVGRGCRCRAVGGPRRNGRGRTRRAARKPPHHQPPAPAPGHAPHSRA